LPRSKICTVPIHGKMPLLLVRITPYTDSDTLSSKYQDIKFKENAVQRPILPTMAADNETHPAAQAVLDFNEAVTTRNMEAGLELLADGGIQYHLHPAHPGMSLDHPLTEDMTAMWTTVSALLS